MSVKEYADKAGVIYFLSKIKSWVGTNYVAKEAGKGLSTNDYTTTEKNKLAGIEAEANKTILDNALSDSSENGVKNYVIKAGLDTKQDTLTPGTNIDITGNVISVTGAVDIDDSTTSSSKTWSSSKISTELGSKQGTLSAGSRISISNENVISAASEINDSTTTSSNTWSADKINSVISALNTLSFAVVQTLPTQDISTKTIYLVPKSTAQTNNVYDEYIYYNNAWEKIGDTEIDLSGYVQESELIPISEQEFDAMFT